MVPDTGGGVLPRRLGIVGDSEKAMDGSTDGAIDGASEIGGNVIPPSPIIVAGLLLPVESSLSSGSDGLVQQTGANSILAW